MRFDRRWCCGLVISLAGILAACGGDEEEEGGGEGESVAAEPVLPPLPDAPAVAAGEDHTCAVKESGEAYCWGRNLDGELGDGTGQNRTAPVPVRGLTEVHAIAPGRYHTCALKRDGTVHCWGRNEYGQLGDGTTEGRAEPVAVRGLNDAIQIGTGQDFSCAVRRDGSVSCWGRGDSGRLGNGGTEDSSTPVAVSGLSDVTRVDLGGQHACALKSDGTLFCWGSDSQGQVGVAGEDMRAHNQPAQVQGLTGVTDVAAGADNTCAVHGGTVSCWGDSYYGKVGNGQSGSDSEDVQTPAAIAGLTGVAEVDVGNYHVCVRLESGAAKCWGHDGYGNLGAAARGDQAAPTDVAQLSDAQELAVGGYHVCALRQTGAISCWGKSGDGQLGVRDADDPYHPGDRIPSLANLTAEAPPIHTFEPSPGEFAPMVSIASGYACGVRDDGHVVCWGSNGSGQLGNGTTVGSTEATVEVPGISDAVEVRAGSSGACVRRANGAVACWGSIGRYNGSEEYQRSSRPVPLEGVTDARMLAVDGSGLCILREGGTVTCNHNGAQAPIEGLSGVAQIVGGAGTACARLEDGGVRCWGSGSFGQLGNGAEDSSYRTPVEVSGIRGATQLAFGSYHACALVAGGQVSCWGTNRYGTIGNGQSGEGAKATSPVPVRGLRGVVEIAAGTYNSLARLEDGSILCWGANDYDQCGLGQTSENRVAEITRPQPVAAGTDPALATMGAPAQLACGQNECCVMHASGRLACWGSSSVLGSGSLGGLISSRSNVPRSLSHVTLGQAAPAEAAPAPAEVAPAEAPTEAAPTPAERQRSHRALVERAVRTAAQGCYGRLGMRGPVVVRVTVGPDGRVTTSQVVQNSTGNQEVGRCISGAMVGRRFTAPRQGAVTFDIPFSG